MNKGLELLYVYIHDINRCYKRTDFTFTNDYEISYFYEDKKIVIKEKENKYKDFYGDKIRSIHLVVGKNGSGKSTLIDLVGTNCLIKNETECDGWFAVYKIDENSFYVVGYNSSLLPIAEDNTRVNGSSNYDISFEYDFNDQSINTYHHVQNRFPTKIISSRIPRNSKVSNVSDKSHDSDTYSSILYQFITQSKLTSIYSLFAEHKEIIEELKANSLEIDEDINTGFGPIDGFKIELPDFSALPNKLHILHLILSRCIHSMLEKNHNSRELEHFKNKIHQLPNNIRIIENNENQLDLMAELLFKIIDLKYETYTNGELDHVGFIQFKKNLKDIISILSTSTNENILDGDKFAIKINQFDSDIYHLLNLMDAILEFCHYNNMLYKDEIKLRLSKISEGESLFLEMFSNIYQAVKEENIQEGSILLFLDEPDKSFHPEWSAKLIHMLKSLIEKTTIGKDLTFQIIITTHSPFMISDVPKEYITCIDIDENGNRLAKESKYGFASNFYDIIQDSFFLKSSIGEFATNKINNWIIQINTSTSDEELLLIEKQLDVIDDVVIKSMLKKQISLKLKDINKQNLLNKKVELLMKLKQIDEDLGNNYDSIR